MATLDRLSKAKTTLETPQDPIISTISSHISFTNRIRQGTICLLSNIKISIKSLSLPLTVRNPIRLRSLNTL